MSIAKMRMLRWIRDKARNDKIKNKHFQENSNAASIGDKIRDLFEMVWTSPTQASNGASNDGPPTGRGRPKRKWMEILTINPNKCNLPEDLAKDRSEQRKGIHVAEPNIVGPRL